MKGHVRPRGKDTWSIVLYIGKEDGQSKYKWHSFKGSEKEANKELRRLLHEMDTGGYVEPANMTVAVYLEKWLADYAETNVTGKTLERYRQIVRNNLIPELGRHKLPKLQPLHIQSAYTYWLKEGRQKPITEKLEDGTVKIIEAGLSAQTVLHFHRVLHEALKQAVRWQLLARNPADAVEPPKIQRKEMKIIAREDVEQLLEACSGSIFYMPVLLAVCTGMRRGEILALQWGDIDLDAGYLSVCRSLEQTKEGLAYKEPKTDRSRRRIDLPDLAVRALRKHKGEQAQLKLLQGEGYQDNGLVCCQDDGWPIPPDYLSDIFRFKVKAAGLEHIRFHDLRHTHATILLQEGVHAKVVSERLGHSNIGITLDTYSHVIPTMQAEAARTLDNALRTAANNGRKDK